MKRIIIGLIPLVITLLGCQKKEEVTEAEELQEAIEQAIDGDLSSNSASFYVPATAVGDTSISDTTDTIPNPDTTTVGGDTLDFIRGWYRELGAISRSVTTEVDGDTAEVTIELTLDGTLVIYGPESTIEKPFTDKFTRYLKLERDANGEILGKWKINAFSMGKMVTETPSVVDPIQIDSIRIKNITAGTETLITTPSDWWQKEDILTYDTSDDVEVYLYVENPTTTLGYLHRLRARVPFAYDESAGALVWKGERTAWLEGYHFVAFDVIPWYVLFTSDPNNYESEAWVFIYKAD